MRKNSASGEKDKPSGINLTRQENSEPEFDETDMKGIEEAVVQLQEDNEVMKSKILDYERERQQTVKMLKAKGLDKDLEVQPILEALEQDDEQIHKTYSEINYLVSMLKKKDDVINSLKDEVKQQKMNQDKAMKEMNYLVTLLKQRS